MPSLAETQRAFASALTDPAQAPPAEIRRPGGAPGAKGQTKRFDVYRNNVAVAAIDALTDIFPAVLKLAGEEFFRAAARVFIGRTPPASPLLFRYGAGFGDFLDGFPPAASTPYLGDVARLEFERLQAHHAADAAPVGIGRLGEIPSGEAASVKLTPHPSVSLVRSKFPVVSLWGASTGEISSDDVDMSRSEDALIVRPGLEVETRILPPGGGAFLGALLAGRTLGEAAEAGARADGGFDLSAHLAGLFEAGAFIEILKPGAAESGRSPSRSHSAN